MDPYYSKQVTDTNSIFIILEETTDQITQNFKSLVEP